MASTVDLFETVLDRHYPRDPETGERALPPTGPPPRFAELRKYKRPWWRFW